MPDESNNEPVEYKFADSYEGESVVKVWCDGRKYEPDTESYHPVYSYSITTPKWSYVNNDITGGANEEPSLEKGAQSLFAFLYACQQAKPGSDNYETFPPQVRDWAYHFSEEISSISLQIEAKG